MNPQVSLSTVFLIILICVIFSRLLAKLQQNVNEKFVLPNPELEGEIYYLTEQEGGRKGYVKSGYRGQFFYNGSDWDAPQEFIDKEICNLGENVNIRLQTSSPDFHVGQFYVGQAFETREGAKTVGRGKITKILRQNFNYWDFDIFFKNLPANCKPYDNQNIEGFIADFDYGLYNIKQIGNLKFTKSLSDKYQMLTIECKLKDKNIEARPLIDEICKSWREKNQIDNLHYKIDLKHFDKGFTFELTFVTWHSMFLTGKIIVNTA